MYKLFYFFLFLVAGTAAAYLFQNKRTGKGIDPGNRYVLVDDWPGLQENLDMGQPTGVGIDTSQDIVIFHRAGRTWPLLGSMPNEAIRNQTILVLDNETGKRIKRWGDNLFIMPHGLTVDAQNNIWVTDVGLHQVMKFTHDGKLLLSIGEAGIPGDDEKHFNRPTDVAVLPDGSFFVSDGYRNSRIIRFSQDGKFLYQWGHKGSGDGEFRIPHGISLDPSGNVYVADRENNRIQVFDSAGRLTRSYNGNFGSMFSIAFDKKTNQLFTTDDVSFLKIKHRGSDVIVMDTAGNVRTRFGRSSPGKGSISWYHDICIDDAGNIYVADIKENRVLKFRMITASKPN